MEFEFKLQVPAARLAGVRAELHGAGAERIRLRSRYFDTADGRLAAHGLVLRLRQEGRRWVQAVKAPGRGPLEREEHEVEVGQPGGGAAALAAVPDPARHAGSRAGERLVALLGDASQPGGYAPLLETYATDIVRNRRTVEVGGSRVELALDQGTVMAGTGATRRSDAVCELEMELLHGPVLPLADLAGDWCRRHRLWIGTLSKSARGERLLQASRGKSVPPPVVKAQLPQLGRQASGAALQRAVVQACLAHVLPNAAEVAAGSTDAAQVHQLRVALRRLRTALRELGGLAPGIDPAWEPALADAFRRLGTWQDQRNVVQKMQPELQAAGGPDVDLPADRAGGEPPGDVVRSPDLQSTLAALAGFAAPGQGSETDGEDGSGGSRVPAGLRPRRARTLLGRRLDKLHGKVVHDGRRFGALPPEVQHGVRKRLKRLRYLAEFTASLFGAERAAPFLKHLGPAQDALGRFNDEAVALAVYAEAAAADPRAWFAVGWLTARRGAGAEACRRAVRTLGREPVFWQAKAAG